MSLNFTTQSPSKSTPDSDCILSQPSQLATVEYEDEFAHQRQPLTQTQPFQGMTGDLWDVDEANSDEAKSDEAKSDETKYDEEKSDKKESDDEEDRIFGIEIDEDDYIIDQEFIYWNFKRRPYPWFWETGYWFEYY